MGSTVEVEPATVGATPSSPRRVEEVPGPDGGQLAPVVTEAALLPPPPPLQRRLAVSKRLHPRSCQTHLVEDPPLAPRKALKVNVSSSAHQAAEAQAGVQRGAASGGAVSKEAAAQEKGAEAAAERVEEGEPTPHNVVGLGAKEARASIIAEAVEGEAGAPETSKARAVDAGAIEVEMAEARAPGSIEAEAMEVETEQILAPPLVQTISSDDSSRGKEAADVEEASTVEQPAELVTAKGQAAPLEAKIKELEEERDSFRSRAQEAAASVKATAGQLGAEQSEHQATRVALAEVTKAAEASWVEVLAWKNKAEDLKKEASQAAEASVAAQAALDAEVREHEALRSAVRTAYEALDVEEVQSASSLGSCLIALSGRVRERLRGALHTGVKRALAVVSSHYAINLEAVSDGYVLPEDDEEADAERFFDVSIRMVQRFFDVTIRMVQRFIDVTIHSRKQASRIKACST
ncbi:uncharacterized protein [Miscanthus floridulus]|uniref:uncharacterized protein n=1 Tax=Miscanthus floridulus TaxID=154761 RepID=UPI0034575198